MNQSQQYLLDGLEHLKKNLDDSGRLTSEDKMDIMIAQNAVHQYGDKQLKKNLDQEIDWDTLTNEINKPLDNKMSTFLVSLEKCKRLVENVKFFPNKF
jgi:hypothetical protein